MASLGQGDAVVHISSGSLATILLHLPETLEEQEQISLALEDADKAIRVIEEKIEKTSTLKTALMQQLLTGKVRLK